MEDQKIEYLDHWDPSIYYLEGNRVIYNNVFYELQEVMDPHNGEKSLQFVVMKGSPV
ncbi:hypothetical protein KAR91_69735 [Candidatus Pacearchaeota archaeon]|nr:hypothetical protein [Candidatus Pacearchaeota archaeon]